MVRRVSDVLIVGDTFRCPELRHELPVPVIGSCLYAERGGRRYAFIDALEAWNLEPVDGVEVCKLQSLGFDELVREMGAPDAFPEVAARACRSIGLDAAVVPRAFPLELADFLRKHGVAIRADGKRFDLRRRSKTAQEIEGIRRGQRAAEAAMAAVREALLGGVRSCEKLKTIAEHALTDANCKSEALYIAHGLQTADPTNPGSGEIAGPGESVIVDIFPRDLESWCFADMTRTFCLGPPPPWLADIHRACDEARVAVIAAVRPGVSTATLAKLACDVLRDRGYRTFLDAADGETLTEGAVHLIGHGVGFELTEAPVIWHGATDLLAGDVFSVEPGLYLPGRGGCRIEDLVHVTEDGVEVLTQFPYELEL